MAGIRLTAFLTSWQPARLRPGIVRLMLILALAGAYLVLGLASFRIQVLHGIVTPVCFLPEGIALAAVLLIGPQIWPGVFLGQWLLALAQGLPMATALAIATINSTEAVVATLLFRRLGLRPDLRRLRDIVGLLLMIVVVLQPFSATLGTASLWLSGVLSNSKALPQAWLDWWVGNTMGQVLLTPLLLSLFEQGRRPSFFQLRQAALTLALMVPVALISRELMATQATSMVLVLFTPALVLLAIRPGLAGVSAACMAITFSALGLTSRGLGPFIAGDQVHILDLNVFVLGLGITTQVLAVLLQERRLMEEELRQLAFFDPLTQLPNRRQLQERLQSLAKARRVDGQLQALIFLDLDRFKEINDIHGHDIGDLLLVTMARRLRHGVRQEDLVSRLGGDEFVVLLLGLAGERSQAERQASQIGRALCDQLGAPCRLDGIEITCTASHGISLFAAGDLKGRQILREADRAMYEAKRRKESHR